MGAALSRQPAGEGDQPQPTRRTRAPRTSRVRHTLDLEPATHKQLKMYCLEHEAHLADVFRVLGELLLEDEQLAERVADRLYQQRQ